MNSRHFMPALSCSFMHFTGLQNEGYKTELIVVLQIEDKDMTQTSSSDWIPLWCSKEIFGGIWGRWETEYDVANSNHQKVTSICLSG